MVHVENPYIMKTRAIFIAFRDSWHDTALKLKTETYYFLK